MLNRMKYVKVTLHKNLKHLNIIYFRGIRVEPGIDCKRLCFSIIRTKVLCRLTDQKSNNKKSRAKKVMTS